MLSLSIIGVIVGVVLGVILLGKDKDELEIEAGVEGMEMLSNKLKDLYKELDYIPGKDHKRAEAVVYEIKATELRIADTITGVR
jgi:hypothetical protein